jgi:DNA replication regulator DPB11
MQLAEVVASVPAPVFGDAFETYDDDINLLERSSVGDESMRVTYVDPGQRDEKKRLMSLLRSDKVLEGGEGGKASSLRTRRSARIAGF